MLSLLTREISNSDDIIDSRAVIERIAELESFDSLDYDDKQELEDLREFAEEGANYLSEWHSGVTLVRESYFTEYAQNYAEDIGAIEYGAGWPAYCIDWERAAADLQMDYMGVDFRGVTYWGR